MFFTLSFFRAFYYDRDGELPSNNQSFSNIDTQFNAQARRHHADAIQSFRRVEQRYFLERKFF